MNETRIALVLEQLEAFLNSEMSDPYNVSKVDSFPEKTQKFLNQLGLTRLEEVAPFIVEFDLFLEGKTKDGRDVRCLCLPHQYIRVLPKHDAQEMIRGELKAFVAKYGTEPKLVSVFRVKRMEL